MHPVLLGIIVITVLISLVGFQKPEVFEKYKFNVGAIQNRKEYIRLLSAGFLHADFGHLFFNMLTLYFFAPVVLYVYGVQGFLIIYFASIVIGNLFSLYLYKRQSWYSAIGASGGVSGILFAAVAYAPKEISVNFLPGFAFGALYFAYSVYMMLNPRANDNIGHAAHLGGAAFGLFYAVALQPEVAMSNARYLLIMSLPLIYMGYEVFVKKRIG